MWDTWILKAEVIDLLIDSLIIGLEASKFPDRGAAVAPQSTEDKYVPTEYRHGPLVPGHHEGLMEL